MRFNSQRMTLTYSAPLRDLQAHKLLHGAAVGVFVVEIGDVVNTVEESDDLVVLLTLAQLLGAPVEIAYVGLAVDDLLPVDPKHQPKDAVSRRVLGPHVEKHLDGLRLVWRLPGNLSHKQPSPPLNPVACLSGRRRPPDLETAGR